MLYAVEKERACMPRPEGWDLSFCIPGFQKSSMRVSFREVLKT